jgi:hypothetical protein
VTQHKVTLSESSIALFHNLLGQVQVPASAPDFEQQAAVVSVARRELTDIVNQLNPAPAAGVEDISEADLDDPTPINREQRRAAAKVTRKAGTKKT